MEKMDLTRHETSRRDFLKTTAAGVAVATAGLAGFHAPVSAEAPKSTVHFPPLPYPENSLEPYISAKTLNLHYDKHYRKYWEQVMERVKGTEYRNAPLEKIIKETYGGITMLEALHLMAVMAWNHDFYWKSMKPKGGGELPLKLKEAITGSFGNTDIFKIKFKEAAMNFGSGWAWLVLDNGKPAVTWTAYHETPLLKNQTPLLTIDCWEHAYYLDYQNRKEEYIDAFINHLANWSFAENGLTAPVAPAAKKTEKKK